jgi:hypothetical protein
MKSSEIVFEETDIKGDSREVIKAWYTGRLMQLEKELDQFTLEQPLEILRICRRMKMIKIKLKAINSEKKEG